MSEIDGYLRYYDESAVTAFLGVLGEHEYEGEDVVSWKDPHRCSCGDWSSSGPNGRVDAEAELWDDHLLRMLAAEGVAVIRTRFRRPDECACGHAKDDHDEEGECSSATGNAVYDTYCRCARYRRWTPRP